MIVILRNTIYTNQGMYLQQNGSLGVLGVHYDSLVLYVYCN